ncbi:hypothetical protein [Sphingomonas sp. IW22]|uniref:hypothetical protein n=1 Tax=Sphingomonas sp. IW22 TaxID=3242489 RepID=UPI00351F9AE1
MSSRTEAGAVHRTETFAAFAHYCDVRFFEGVEMSKVVPVILSLIPLAAVISACVAVP